MWCIYWITIVTIPSANFIDPTLLKYILPLVIFKSQGRRHIWIQSQQYDNNFRSHRHKSLWCNIWKIKFSIKVSSPIKLWCSQWHVTLSACWSLSSHFGIWLIFSYMLGQCCRFAAFAFLHPSFLYFIVRATFAPTYCLLENTIKGEINKLLSWETYYIPWDLIQPPGTPFFSYKI